MATVTITFTDIDEKKGGVQITINSEPGFTDEKGTAAQHLGVKMLDILNQQLDREEAEDDDECCHHEGCGCHDEIPANAKAPQRKPKNDATDLNYSEPEMMGS